MGVGMGKYTSYKDLSENAPKLWAEGTDPNKYEEGMNRVAPSGKRLKKARKDAYGAHTTEVEGRRWLERWTVAMFE